MTAPAPVTLPPEVDQTLGRLRRSIRQYVLFEGAALVAVLLGALFWGSFLADLAYFQLSRLELPRWLRAAFLVAAAGTLAAGALTWVVLRLVRALRLRALALVLERRFPEFGDSLITAVEVAEGSLRDAGGYQQAMLQRAVLDAARHIQRLDLSQVFDRKPLRRAVIWAGALIGSILGLAVVDSAAMDRWLAGYVGLRDSYWPRATQLDVKVLTQPGDRIREFRDGRYRHPRGGDLSLIIDASHSRVKPDRVRLDYRLRNAGLRRTYLSAVGDQPFPHTFPALLDSVDLWVRGGDYASPRALRVEVVDPPQLDRLTLETLYPDYTGLNARDAQGAPEPTSLEIHAAQISLPLGSRVQVRGVANKPLLAVRLEVDVGSDRYEIELGRAAPPGAEPAQDAPAVAAWVTLRSREGRPQLRAPWPASAAAALLSADGRTFSLPLVLAPQAAEQLPQAIAAAASGAQPLPLPLPWPTDAPLRIHLEDADGIASPEPTRLVINGVVDQPPVVDVELRGVGQAVTRQARIPVAGRIRDEYGVAQARFEFQIDAEPEWRPREFSRPLTAVAPEFTLARSEDEAYERFDVLPLDLSIGQKLTLTVLAEDGDALRGPNRQRSQRFVFTIVPVEELLSILYAKELNLRKRFEQLLGEMKDLQKDLQLHRERADSRQRLRDSGQTTADEAVRQLESALSASAERALHTTRKNATETAAIEAAFGEIRKELINNAAETPQNMDRLEHKILGPLNGINTVDFPELDAALGLFRLANEKGTNPQPAIDSASREAAELVERMERVLLEMRKLETFHEALELLKSIIGAQDELKEETKTERKARALRALEGLDK